MTRGLESEIHVPDQPPTSLRPNRPTARFRGRHPAATDFLMLTTMYAPPRLPRRPVHRERLVTRLTDGVRSTPLTLVSAPAGCGKTTLAASWMEDPGIPWSVVWLTLSEATASPEGFWFFVTEALSRAGVDLPHTTGLTGLLPVYDGLVTQLATDLLNRAEPVVLVLDEVDRLTDPDVPRQLELLLRLAAARIRLVLLSRVDPLLPVQRYRLTGTMTQIRAADLAFTLEEARSLLSGSGIDLPDEALEALHARTEGWAAGLQLAALTRQQLPPAERDAGGWLPGPQDANLAEYLTGEILNAQPVHLRDFLLHTSVVDLVSAELAEALTGEAGAGISLMTLVHRNILMEAVGDLPGCYHAHPLLRELLRAQLAYESPERVPELHLKAARWFADAGMVNQAVAHFASAGSWEQAAELVVDDLLLGVVLVRPSTPGAQRLADMPSTTAGASAAVVRAAFAVGRSDLAACDAALDQVAEAAPSHVRPQLDVAVAATRLSAAAARGDHQQVLGAAARLELALGAITLQGAGSIGFGGQVPDLRSLLLSAKGEAQLHLGALPEASATLSQAVVASVAAGLGAG